MGHRASQVLAVVGEKTLSEFSIAERSKMSDQSRQQFPTPAGTELAKHTPGVETDGPPSSINHPASGAPQDRRQPVEGERDPGRPTGATDEDGLRPGVRHEDAPTEAPEEHGASPAVENAPGGDL